MRWNLNINRQNRATAEQAERTLKRNLAALKDDRPQIRRIRQKLDDKKKAQDALTHEKRPTSELLDQYDYHIGITQDHPVDLKIFAQEKRQDPAAKV